MLWVWETKRKEKIYLNEADWLYGANVYLQQTDNTGLIINKMAKIYLKKYGLVFAPLLLMVDPKSQRISLTLITSSVLRIPWY